MIVLRVANVVFWLALSLWIAALVSGGIAAYAVFGELPTMAMHLPQYHAAPRSEHGMIAAGHVMQTVFRVTDLLQYIAAPIVIAAMIIDLIMLRERRWWMSNVLRVLCIVIAGAALAYRAVDLTPRMDRELQAYRAAAGAGNPEEARARRAAFTALHPRVRMIMTTSLLLLMTATGSSSIALGGGLRPNRRDADGHA